MGLWAGNQAGGYTKVRAVGEDGSRRGGGSARPGSNEGEELKRMNKGARKFFFHTMQRRHCIQRL